VEKDLWRSPLLRPLCELENIIDPSAGSEASMFFTFPEDAHWNADRQAVEFGVEIASTAVSSGSRGACSSVYFPSRRPRSGASRLLV